MKSRFMQWIPTLFGGFFMILADVLHLTSLWLIGLPIFIGSLIVLGARYLR